MHGLLATSRGPTVCDGPNSGSCTGGRAVDSIIVYPLVTRQQNCSVLDTPLHVQLQSVWEEVSALRNDAAKKKLCQLATMAVIATSGSERHQHEAPCNSHHSLR